MYKLERMRIDLHRAISDGKSREDILLASQKLDQVINMDLRKKKKKSECKKAEDKKNEC